MKNLQPIYFLIIFCLLAGNLFAQTASETGGWFYYHGQSGEEIYPKSHFAPPNKFPVDGIKDGSYKVVYTPKEKSKMIKIVEAMKEVYPKPKYHSMMYAINPATPSTYDLVKFKTRNYRFGYDLGFAYEYMKFANGKMIDQPIGSGDFLWEFSVIGVSTNRIPDFLGGGIFSAHSNNAYEGPKFLAEADFSFKKYNGQRSLPTGGAEREAFPRDETKDLFVSIESRDHSFGEAAKHLGTSDGMPPLKFGNEGDNYFVFRRFTSSRLHHSGVYTVYGKNKPENDRSKVHTIDNMVILSHNNKLPFKPVTIERFLNVADNILDELDAYNKQYLNTTEAIKKEIFEKNARTREFIQNLREIYKNRLQEPAIIDSRYSQVSDISWGHIYANNKAKQPEILNLITGKREPANQVASRFFVSDPKLGKAFYTYDRDFYKNMADGEIRTICVIWKDYVRMPDHPDFGKGYQIGKDGVIQNRFSDNPDHYLYHFSKKFDWKKLEAVLGK